MIAIFILILSLIALTVYYLYKKFYFWRDLGIPFVQPEFPYGNLRGVGTIEHTSERLIKFYREWKGKSPFVGIYLFLRPMAVLIDLDLVKSVLIRDFEAFHDRGVFFNEKDEPISAHLFALNGPKWKRLRSKLTPTFTSGKMKYMFPTVIQIGERLEKRIGELSAASEEIEIKDIFARYTTDVIGSCAFGLECNSMYDQSSEFREAGIKVFDKPRHNNVIMGLCNSFRELGCFLRVKTFHDEVTDFFSNTIKDTVEYREKNNIERRDFLNLTMEIRKEADRLKETPFTMDEMIAQSFIFFLAGFETSSTLLTYCFYELSVNQDIQDKTRQHIEEVLERHEGQFTYDAMLEMKYLDKVVNETLRKYPPLSNITRAAVRDYKVPNTNYVIKNGTLITVPIHAIQHDPEYYPNPEKFDPENFSEENVKKRNPLAFLPFGEGPRICIGLRFGMMQARIGLVHLLRKYKFSLGENQASPLEIGKSNFILSPKDGVVLKVQRI